MNQRISLFLARYSNSGVPRNRLSLAAGFAAHGFSVDLVLIRGALPEYERQALPETVRVVELGKGRVMSALPTVVRYLRETRPIAAIAAEEHLNIMVIIAVRLARVSSAVSVSFHVPPEREASKRLWQKGRWNSLLGHWVFPRASAIVAVSSGLADGLARVSRLPRETIHVIYNPVVRDALFEKAKQEPQPVIDCGPDFILSVGRLSSNKGYADLIDAFALIQSKSSFNLVILGEGVARPGLEEKIRRLGLEERVFLPGAVDNPFAWMVRAKLFVLASYFEGLSNVLVEAMACGCPVVSTDCPTGPREILQDGRCGSLVPLRDPRALADAMLESLDNPLGSELLVKRSLDFHVDLIVDQYLNALGLDPERASC